MPKSVVLLLALLVAGATAPALALSGNVVGAPNVRARLESAVRGVGPGQSFRVALVLDLAAGWHTYWRNPGDSGRATRIAWTLPAGFRADPIEWPVPQRFLLAPLVNFGYANTAVYLVRIQAPATLRAVGPVTLRADASWLVCSDVCIPEGAKLTLTLPTRPTPGSTDPAAASLFAHAIDALPRPATGTIDAAMRDGRIVIRLGPDVRPSLAGARSLQFVPYEDGMIEYAAPQRVRREGGTIEISMQPGFQPHSGPLRGLVIATQAGGGATPTRVALAIAPVVRGSGGAGLCGLGSGRFACRPLARAAPGALLAHEVVVVDELVAARDEQVRGGVLHAEPDDALVVLAQLRDERREVRVAADDDEGVDVRLGVAQVESVDHHADVGGVLAGLLDVGNLDQLESGVVHAGPKILVALPVAVGLLDHDRALEQQPLQHPRDVELGIAGVAHA